MKKIIAIMMTIILLGSMVACGSSSSSDTADTSTTTSSTSGSDTAETVATRDDVNIIVQVEADSLDPQGTTMQYALQVLAQLNDTLMEYDAAGNLVCSLAESYTANEDSTVYTFTLKQGVMFHDGEEMTASDVVYTINRGQNHDFSPQNYSLIENCVAISDYEVEFTLVQSYAPFLSVLATPGFAILSEGATEEAGSDFGRAPVGCGPYQFEEWVSGESIKMTAFEDYHKGTADITSVTFKFIGDSNTALINLESGDVDYSYLYPEASTADIEDSDDMQLFYYDSTALQFFTLNTTVTELSDARVRQAINMAINRDDIIIVAAEGAGVATSFYANTNTLGYVEMEGYVQDVDAAKALMAEAGYGDGFTITVTAQDTSTQKMAQVFSDAVKAIGITCEIETLESNTAVSNFMTGAYEIGVLGINNAQMDLDFMKVLFDTDGALNLSNIDCPDVVEMFAQAGALSDTEARLEIYRNINEILMELAPYVPVYYPNRAHAMASDLSIDYVGGSGIAYVYNMHWN